MTKTVTKLGSGVGPAILLGGWQCDNSWRSDEGRFRGLPAAYSFVCFIIDDQCPWSFELWV